MPASSSASSSVSSSASLRWVVPILVALLAASPAAAVGGGGGSGGGGGGGNAGGPGHAVPKGAVDDKGGATRGLDDLTVCKKGTVWSPRKRACLKARAGVLPDDELTQYAYALAKAERYEEAIATLDGLRNPQTARALNYRGYATRKLGKTAEGIEFYKRSIALDPAYAQVREYLGEAYVIQGRVDLAKEQLQIIKTLCGTECEEYEDLHKAITDGGDT